MITKCEKVYREWRRGVGWEKKLEFWGSAAPRSPTQDACPMPLAVASFMDLLTQTGLLAPWQVRELAARSRQFPSQDELTADLLRRGWLTK